MEASTEISRTSRRMPPCSDVSVLQKTRMSHFWDTHHNPQNIMANFVKPLNDNLFVCNVFTQVRTSNFSKRI